MVVIALIDVKDCNNQLILVLNKFLKQLDVIRVSKVVSCEHVDLIHQVLLPLWQRTLRSLNVSAKGLREWRQFVGELNIGDHSVDVSV